MILQAEAMHMDRFRHVNSFLEGCVMQKGQDDGLRCTLKLSENHYQKAEYCVPFLSSLAEFMCPYGGLTLQKTCTWQSSASQLSSTRGGCMVKFVTSRESSSCFPWLSYSSVIVKAYSNFRFLVSLFKARGKIQSSLGNSSQDFLLIGLWGKQHTAQSSYSGWPSKELGGHAEL